jgi:predicted amino acid racemase
MYPQVQIDLQKIRHNAELLVNKAKEYNVRVVGVTKVFCGHLDVARAMAASGVALLGDTRLENLMKLAEIPLPKLLLRLPMPSQVREVVRVADISLNSSLTTIKALSQAALAQGKKHNVILMLDLGDLREGIFNKASLKTIVPEMLGLEGICFYGVGVNLTCVGGVIPRESNTSELLRFKKQLERDYGIEVPVVSGGNSSSLHLLFDGKLPEGINQLRLGESIVLGRETAFGQKIENTHDDCFRLVAEVIEVEDKPTVPIGEIGMDAFGNKPVFEEKGIRRRAILAAGKQDVDPNDLIPDDDKITVLGASSDHLVMDITDSAGNYKVGDMISFRLSYGGILRVMTSAYVEKVILTN